MKWPKIKRCKIWSDRFHVDHNCHDKPNCWNRIVYPAQIKKVFSLLKRFINEDRNI